MSQNPSRIVVSSVVIEAMLLLILLGAVFTFVIPLKTIAGYKVDTPTSSCSGETLEVGERPVIEQTKVFHILGGQLDDYQELSQSVVTFDRAKCADGPAVQYKLFL